MNKYIWCIPVLAVMLVCCGCVQDQGDYADPALYNQSLQSVREFMENDSYEPDAPSFTVYEGISILRGSYEEYAVDPSSGKVISASYEGTEGIFRAKQGPHYDRAMEAVQQFLQNPDFEINASSFRYEDDRYEISGTNITFRVNATSGAVVRAMITGPEAGAIMENSTGYKNVVASSDMNGTA
ncbi:MAG TPA: hypothetical protein VMW63_02035 [Methanoregulaceae archaeon]|nr:hypothetical protein [Methanoregulaceae archaeon]